jgi:sorbitol-specific phosphotransferase system component IIBC
MLFFVGAIIVVGSVLGGFMWHGGQPLALNQPNEVLIIGGAALGSLIIATPIPVIKAIIAQLMAVLTGKKYAKRTTSISWSCCTKFSTWPGATAWSVWKAISSIRKKARSLPAIPSF